MASYGASKEILETTKESRPNTALQDMNREFDRQNDQYCSLIERLEAISDRLLSNPIAEGPSSGKENKPRQPGSITDYSEHVGRQAILNSRLDSVITNLEKLV